MRTWPDNGVAFGGDYNPEQWPRETWDDDIRLMQKAGVTFVTVGVFSWSWLEPKEGLYEFEWLDAILDKLHAAGIAVDLATATAAPPVWLSQTYPDSLPVDYDGRVLGQGSRQAWCPSSQSYLRLATSLAREMAQRYHDHPAVAMWHVGNEYGCHNTPCYCERCAEAFRPWLQRRYGDLDALNDAWGTAFWSQRYGDWEHILPPRPTPTFHNPTQVLDYKRFMSDQLLAQYQAELAVLREVSPGIPVTTNFMTLEGFRHLDYFRWAQDVDIVSTDHYRVDTLPDASAELSFCGDLTRGIAGGKPWMLMEHATSAVNWQPHNPMKLPGQTIRDSITHVAHGADVVGYFQWRQSRAGAEKWHSALVPHAGEDSKRFREVVRLGEILGRLGPVLGSSVDARVAILFDYHAQWAVAGPAMPSTLDYPHSAHRLHDALRRLHVSADVVHPSAPLDGYDLVIVPTLYLVSDENARRVAQVAERGAHVLVTYSSGLVDEDDHVRLGGYPGAFAELLGIRTEELNPLLPGTDVGLDDGSRARIWSEDLTLTDAEAVLRYTDGPLAGQPAVTRRDAGDGVAWYLTTELADETLRTLVARVVEEAGVEPVDDAPAEVELVRRRRGEQSFLFVINPTEQEVEVAANGHDLVRDEPVRSVVRVPARDVAVIAEA